MKMPRVISLNVLVSAEKPDYPRPVLQNTWLGSQEHSQISCFVSLIAVWSVSAIPDPAVSDMHHPQRSAR